MSRIQQAFSSLGGRGADQVAYSGNGALAARVSPALEAYAAMTTSAARGAIRDVSQVKQR